MRLGVVGCWLYVRHAQRAPAPLLDLSLLKVETFYASVVGGFLFRVGIGAMPFLLPLMFQLGFGMTPVPVRHADLRQRRRRHRHEDHRGADPPPFRLPARAGGQRRREQLLHRGGGFVHAGTPHIVILAVLLVGGFFRSLEFTTINSIAYADIDTKAMSQATSFASVAQQLSLSAGVAVGALVLEFERMGRPDGDRRGRRFPARLPSGRADRGELGACLRQDAEGGRRKPDSARPVGAPGSPISQARA